jgi:hypothetical protein
MQQAVLRMKFFNRMRATRTRYLPRLKDRRFSYIFGTVRSTETYKTNVHKIYDLEFTNFAFFPFFFYNSSERVTSPQEMKWHLRANGKKVLKRFTIHRRLYPSFV